MQFQGYKLPGVSCFTFPTLSWFSFPCCQNVSLKLFQYIVCEAVVNGIILCMCFLSRCTSQVSIDVKRTITISNIGKKQFIRLTVTVHHGGREVMVGAPSSISLRGYMEPLLSDLIPRTCLACLFAHSLLYRHQTRGLTTHRGLGPLT